MAAKSVVVVDVHQLASVVRNRIDNVMILDSRSFLEFNTCHVIGAVNVCCSKIVKRRLQQDKVSVKELIGHSCQTNLDINYDIVVYDQASKDVESIPADCFLSVLLSKLLVDFRSINLVSGGFLEFQAFYPNLLEDKTRKSAPLTSLSQPCLSIYNQGPTHILPFMYLGSQHDALNSDLLKEHDISYILNVSTSCPKPDFIQDGHFMRIAVNDNYSEKLLPHFPKAFQFLDKVRENNNGKVLVHCLAGISRSATIAIAYVMRFMKLTSDESYRYVKSKRVTISPNFNFLGQLLEYEKQLRRERVLEAMPEPQSAPILRHPGQKRICRDDMRSTCKLTLNLTKPQQQLSLGTGDQSPTTALAKLSFGTNENSPDGTTLGEPEWPKPVCTYRSVSCDRDWLSVNEDSKVEQGEQVVPRRLDDVLDRSLPVRTFGLTKVSCKPYRGTEGVVPAPLDSLPQVEELECEQDESSPPTTLNTTSATSQLPLTQQKQQQPDVIPKPRPVTWPTSVVSGHPVVTSLKELNLIPIIPCQNSSSSVAAAASAATHNTTTTTTIVSGTTTIKSTSSSITYKFKTEKVIAWSDSPTPVTNYESVSVASSNNVVGKNPKVTSWLQSRVSDTQMDLKLLPESNLKDYKRSDSVSTSGLGSEGSDGIDNWNDEEQQDTRVILRSQSCVDKKTDYGGLGPHPKLGSQFSLTLPREKFTLSMTPDLKSPLSPSERHLLEDIDDALPMTCVSKPIRFWREDQEGTSELESSQDSGILNSPLWDIREYKNEGQPNCDLYQHPTSNLDINNPIVVNLRKRKQGMLEDNVARVTRYNNERLGAASNESTTASSNATQSTIENIPKSSGALYRAQSCPGILGYLPRASSAERLASLRLGGGACSQTVAPPPYLRHNSKTRGKFQNRYSCGSLDQYSYESIVNGGLYPKHDAVGLAGSAGSVVNTDIGAATSGLSGSSHGVFRHSLDMIQVS